MYMERTLHVINISGFFSEVPIMYRESHTQKLQYFWILLWLSEGQAHAISFLPTAQVHTVLKRGSLFSFRNMLPMLNVTSFSYVSPAIAMAQNSQTATNTKTQPQDLAFLEAIPWLYTFSDNRLQTISFQELREMSQYNQDSLQDVLWMQMKS